MPTFQTQQVAADNRNLVRKIQRAIAFLFPTSVDLPDSLFDVDGTLVDIKELGGMPVGMVTPDGWSFTREMESEDISALGYASPVRSDITTVTRSVTFTALEKGRKHMMELAYGTDLTNTTQDATTGEVVFDEPDLPVGQEYRLLVVGSDGPTADNWILGRGFHLVKLESSGDETWGQEGAVQTEYTLKVSTDDTTGTPVRHYMGGTGAVKNKLALGFTAGV